MDFKNLTNRAAERIKSVFSRDNRFFYGAPDQQEDSYYEDPSRGPVQGVYAHAYGQGSQQQPVQQGHYSPQQPVYQPQQGYQQFSGQQQYAQSQTAYGHPPYQPQAQAWQAQPQMAEPVYQHTMPQQTASPQQSQLNQQMQQPDAAVRNRRVNTQHPQQGQAPQQPDNIVPFPGAVEQETRSMDAYVVNITNITGCRQAMSCLRKGQCTLVVMDQLIDKAEVRRYVDMLNGACFALGGTMTRLSVKVGFYILAPAGMMVYTDPVTASANAPRPQMQQGIPQQQQAAYQKQQTAYQPQQAYQPQYQQPGYQQQPAGQPYPQHPQQNPYAPPSQQEGAVNYQDAYNAQRYAQ